ncbi:putative E3 ubiquitin-protein ligase Itchy [Monocercomonoides exilis]|uniref:putative E3 ubiquitin-protein ligase Itchy n=1 Tax=Monocercomonoides exilis TaxID=2049356 RepID=UPI0035596A72|nr:putative E3 ubiquitin-protein ligase Itchy [Monocercomonoides exilis]|eukprot:MONOS_11624.1-p1 / transcript=MONOS_11624.1 / gene=MONOS_11624 / organism=Monocercomonoides_exilis_PA203 / gene_product=Chain A, Crystal Structure Of The Hect Domain Of Itch E3 Ubiquitin Ligase / transcript_product=Chain A, Crystal Structure Of The Hect Domain Of Itch E3 Ubiquitin Ligase / location=Mono_scaffold00594:21669-24244(+) / protein_length=758 / sequence_SO=supercontig / SO=protein_coding / is_pseudo=false
MGGEQSSGKPTTTTNASTIIWTEAGLTDIPKESLKFTKVQTMNLSSNLIASVPEHIQKLKNLTSLNLANNCITVIPKYISVASNIRYLSLSNNKIRLISEQLCYLPHLEVLDLSYNEIVTLPGRIGDLRNLKELYLHFNLLVDVPDSFGDLQLSKLTLDENPPLSPALARLCEGGCGDQARFITSFVRFRRITQLPAGFSAQLSPEKGVPYFYNIDSKTSSWIDPRYFMFLNTLSFYERRLFSFAGQPPSMMMPLIPISQTPTSSSPTSPATLALLSSPFGTVPQPSLAVAAAAAVAAASASSSSALYSSAFGSSAGSWAAGNGANGLGLLCQNPMCLNPCELGCAKRMCSKCCNGEGCQMHSTALQKKKHKSFNDRAAQMWEKITAMHIPEPEMWREKPRLKVTLRRDHLLQDSFRDVMRANPERLKLRLNVCYFGETGLDYGGLTREWFTLVSEEIVKPDYCLFRPCDGNPGVFQINPHSYVNPAHLEYFRFVGRLLAKALFDRFLVNAYFTPTFYKGIQGTPVCFEDLKLVDLEQYNSLKSIESMDDVEDLCLTFSATTMEFGEMKEIDLIENGRNIDVTKENKNLFIQLKTQYLLEGQVKEQMEQVKFGFNELIPPELVADFSLTEMEQLLCGSVVIDMKDWKKNTNYSMYTESSPQVVWFWNILDSMTNEERMGVFQFVTGTTKIPQGGFANLIGSNGPRKFLINKLPRSTDHLPSSHTCFNQLDLPEYGSQAELEEKLKKAIELGLTGFGEK